MDQTCRLHLLRFSAANIGMSNQSGDVNDSREFLEDVKDFSYSFAWLNYFHFQGLIGKTLPKCSIANQVWAFSVCELINGELNTSLSNSMQASNC